jgi:hypothetical protein
VTLSILPLPKACPTVIFVRQHKTVDEKTKICYNNHMLSKKEFEMSALVEYTLELYKSDKRKKEGKRLVAKEEFAPVTRDYIRAVIESKTKLGFIVEAHETWVTKRNMMTGKTYKERYDTPYFCSPSSETFWSM